MNTSGIFITSDHVKSLPKQDQEFLFRIVGGQSCAAATSNSVASPVRMTQSEDEHFAELSPGQARDFYSGCGEKTRKALEVIAESTSPRFRVADVAEAIGVQPTELAGVWGGLTRRTKTITGDGDAYLVDWTKGDPVLDADGNYVDQTAEVTDLTYHSFRKALGRS